MAALCPARRLASVCYSGDDPTACRAMLSGADRRDFGRLERVAGAHSPMCDIARDGLRVEDRGAGCADDRRAYEPSVSNPTPSR